MNVENWFENVLLSKESVTLKYQTTYATVLLGAWRQWKHELPELYRNGISKNHQMTMRAEVNQ